MAADKLENTLNGGYRGLYGEVVTHDIYRLRKLDWVPDIVFDLGANVGVFTRFARELFPDALIIAVEPDTDNYENLVKFTDATRMVFLNKAIGSGRIWRVDGALNGAHECYFSDGPGYVEGDMEATPNMHVCPIETIMPDVLIQAYLKPGMRSVLKMDIEGNENCVFDHDPSMETIACIDYIAAEVHRYAMKARDLEYVRDVAQMALDFLSQTHNCTDIHPNMWATKKGLKHVFDS